MKQFFTLIATSLLFLQVLADTCQKPTRKCRNLALCKARPCETATCPAHPEATCEDNYCGGCCAWFYVNRKRVDCEEKPSSCTPPKRNCRNRHQCFVEPCSTATCPAYPDAVCTNNYCGGCCAWFYLNGKLVDCDTKGEPTCPEVTLGTVGICLMGCASDADCGDGEKCCSNGCGYQCMAV